MGFHPGVMVPRQLQPLAFSAVIAELTATVCHVGVYSRHGWSMHTAPWAGGVQCREGGILVTVPSATDPHMGPHLSPFPLCSTPPLQVNITGLHAMVSAQVAKGVKVLLVGSSGQVRAAAEQLQNDADSELTKNTIDLFTPDPSAAPYRFSRKTMMIVGIGPQEFQVLHPLPAAGEEREGLLPSVGGG